MKIQFHYPDVLGKKLYKVFDVISNDHRTEAAYNPAFMTLTSDPLYRPIIPSFSAIIAMVLMIDFGYLRTSTDCSGEHTPNPCICNRFLREDLNIEKKIEACNPVYLTTSSGIMIVFAKAPDIPPETAAQRPEDFGLTALVDWNDNFR